MKTDASKLDKSSIDELPSKLTENKLVSNKKPLESLEMIKYITVFHIVKRIC